MRYWPLREAKERPPRRPLWFVLLVVWKIPQSPLGRKFRILAVISIKSLIRQLFLLVEQLPAFLSLRY